MTKKLVKTLMFAALLMLSTGCGETAVDLESLQGKAHPKGTLLVLPKNQMPYTGKYTVTVYGEYGAGRETGTLRVGKKSGRAETHSDSGNLVTVAHYKRGKRNGQYKEFFENGQIKRIGQYKDGEMAGNWVTYHQNGERQSFAQFRNGKLDGQYEMLDEKGLRTAGQFRNGERDGTWELYSADGHLSEAAIYSDGTLESKSVWHYSEGQISRLERFKADGRGRLLQDGKWEWYHPNGLLRQVGYYKNGKQDGQWEVYDESGQTKGVRNYEDGKLINQ